jgi:hypothetical protein
MVRFRRFALGKHWVWMRPRASGGKNVVRFNDRSLSVCVKMVFHTRPLGGGEGKKVVRFSVTQMLLVSDVKCMKCSELSGKKLISNCVERGTSAHRPTFIVFVLNGASRAIYAGSSVDKDVQ